MSTSVQEKWRVWKNVGIVSVSFMSLFTSFGLVSSLQSTINSEAGLGNASQAVIYASLILSSMFIPSLMMKKLRIKWTMMVSELCYSVYIAVQFYPSFATLIPAAVLVGFAAAPLWTAQSTCFTQLGVRHAAVTGNKQSIESSVTWVFGVFFTVFQASSIIGNLIGSFVLSVGTTGRSSTTTAHCGSSFCYDAAIVLANHSSGVQDVNSPENNIPMLMSVMLGFSLLGTTFLFFLDDVDAAESADSFTTPPSACQMLIATFQQLKDFNQVLLIPLSMWTGCEITFWIADFTYAFVSCSWGVEKIGYVMMTAGIAGAVFSLLCGYLVKKIGRIPIFLTAAAISFSLLFAMERLWIPDTDWPEIFFTIAIFRGIADAVWSTLLSTFYGVLFTANKEAAFSNFRLWQSVGFAISFTYANFICINIKLYILFGILLTGMVGYMTIEFRERRKRMMTARSAAQSGIKTEDWSYCQVDRSNQEKSEVTL